MPTRRATDDERDTEGQSFRRTATDEPLDSDEQDTEGQAIRRDAREDDDTEGHGARKV